MVDTLPLWESGSVNDVETLGVRPHLEVYWGVRRPEGKPQAAVVVLPGGGYGTRAPHEGSPFAQLFAAHGITAFVCHYRVLPHRWPASYADAARAIRLVRSKAKELNIDPERVGLMGFSAGGHCACTVGTQPELHHDAHDDWVGKYSARPQRLILGYPVVSFVTNPHQGSCNNLLGENATEEQRRRFSNELHVTKENPATFIFHTADDGAVPVENSLNYAAACSRVKVSCELHVYASGPHGVGMALNQTGLKGWTGLMMDWMKDWWAM
ncbi:MAG: alpha/beta hydrolase [Phycisphaeraceae bacterium]